VIQKLNNKDNFSQHSYLTQLKKKPFAFTNARCFDPHLFVPDDEPTGPKHEAFYKGGYHFCNTRQMC